MLKLSKLDVSASKEDLSKYSKELEELTDSNNHSESLVLVAKIVGNPQLLGLAEACLKIVELERHQPISKYAYSVYERLMTAGERKFGEEEWNSNVKKYL